MSTDRERLGEGRSATRSDSSFRSDFETPSLFRQLLEPAGPEEAPVIPDFQMVRRLGEGSFGEVWLARTLAGVYRAVKVVRPGTFTEAELAGIIAYETHAREHAHLISIFHVGEASGWLYYEMELADGYSTAPTFRAEDYEPRTVEGDLQRRGRLPVSEAVDVARQVLSGLRHLHEWGLLHRDIKPANIVFVEGVAKLADIGLVTPGRQPAGGGHTPAYAPPEGIIDRTGDFYTLGRTLYRMVTGLRADRFGEIPEGLDAAQRKAITRLTPVLERACAADPDRRFQTAEEFDGALEGVCGKRRRRWVFAAGAILLAVAAGLTGWWQWGGSVGGRGVSSAAVSPKARPALSGRLIVLFKESEQANVYYELSP